MVSHKTYDIVGREETTEASSQAMKSENENLGEQLRSFIIEVYEDFRELQRFYPVGLSQSGILKVGEYLAERMNEIVLSFMGELFYGDDQQAKVDFYLMQTFLLRHIEELRAQYQLIEDIKPLLGDWVQGLVELCENRQKVTPAVGKHAGNVLSLANKGITELIAQISTERFEWNGSKSSAYQAARLIEDLKSNLQEAYGFYAGYDPMFTWWTSQPWEELGPRLSAYASVIRKYLVGITSSEEDAIVGQPIGRAGIVSALANEYIAYTPEELILIGEKQYKWCEAEAIKASREMGYGDDWRKAQEKVKNMFVEPGQQPNMVHELAQEAIDYVTEHDMVTVPEIARKYWQTFMMSPARQKVNPFFLGGESIIVSYPTNSMSHEDKLMVMRGNNRPFSRSTVFHEVIPGHHLQYHYMARYKPYRRIFHTPFSTEGWAFYWELILWDRGFADTPENRLGMLFWHMHRCVRIIFSLNFHLGKWTPQQCIDTLVDRVGHERATAEGEVRRSFNGDYGPLYQAGYMLGALQLYQLRRELVGVGKWSEKEFHDRVLKENNMPIELLRALLKGEELGSSYKASWRFYDLEKDDHRS